MYKQISANKRNTILIMITFVVFVGAIGGLFAYFYNDISILIYVTIISIIYVFMQYWLSTSLSVAMAGAREIKKEDNPRLWNIVENLCITTGLPMPKVYTIGDMAPNAFASGRDPQHAIVAVTEGLLKIMNDKELTAVIAHEISHIKNYDIRLSTIVFGLVSIVGLISDLGFRIIYFGGGRKRDNENQSPIGVLILIVTAILAPIAASIAQMAISREREYLADASAAHITRYPEGMISALKKLDTQNRPLRSQNSAMAAMYITNPLKKGILSDLFSTHPSIEKRIARLEDAKTKF